ncbi:MAG: ATP12 family protein [Pseudomonadota bacterium]
MSASERQKRPYQTVMVDGMAPSFSVLLDGRTLKTPAKSAVSFPTRALAEAVAAEWEAQDEKIKPATMPITRLSATAIDRAAQEGDSWLLDLERYLTTDLVCFRAERPRSLVEAQADAWDPIIAELEKRRGIRLCPQTDLIVQDLEPQKRTALHTTWQGLDGFRKTALHGATMTAGSVAIGLALLDVPTDSSRLWDAASVDESFQARQWGEDAEALAALTEKARYFQSIADFIIALSGS